jgi:E3 ubiquitin-protein ligase TRAF7
VVDVVVDSNGCPEKMKYCELNQHLLVCHFSLVECPEGGSLCGKLRKKELDRHLAGCTQYSCVNKSYGCIFTGTKADKDKHEMDCPLKEAGLHNAIETLTEEVKSLKTDREDVQEKLSELAKINITSNAKLEEQAVMIKSLIARVEMLEGEIKHMKSLSASSEGSYTPLKRKKESTRVGRGNGGHRLSSSSMVAQSPSGADHNDYWQMPFTLKCIGTFRGHEQTVWSVVTKSDTLYSSCSGGEIKMWNISDTTRACVKTVKLHSTYVMCLAVSGKYLFSADYEGNVRSWALGTLAAVGSIKAHTDIISAMAVAGDLLFTACYGVVKVLEMSGLTEVHSFTGLQHWVRALAYDHHRDCMYAGCHKKVYIWRIMDNFEQITTELDTDHGTIYALAVSKKYLIIGTQNQNIHIHDIGTHQYLQSLNGHISTVTCLLVSPCERVLFSGSKDSSIQVWSLENLLPIRSLQRHEKCVCSLALSKDTLFSCSEDTEIKLYKVYKM